MIKKQLKNVMIEWGRDKLKLKRRIMMMMILN